MTHQQKILKLAEYLKDIGLEKEASQLISLMSKKALPMSATIEDWYEVIKEVDSDYVDTAYLAASKYLGLAAGYLGKAEIGLKGATPEDIKRITDIIPMNDLVKGASKRDNLIKYASADNSEVYIKAAKFCIAEGIIHQPDYKKANWWKYTKMIGGGAARYLIPFVSAIFAMINFYYCAVEFSKLMSEVPAAGLSWYEPLMPEKLFEASKQNKDNPDLLQKIAKATKTCKVFVSEAISYFLNSIDAVKDIIFFFADIGTGGWAIAIDLGISFAIMLTEWAIKGQILPYYDKTVDWIRTIAADNIKSSYSSDLDGFESFESSDEKKDFMEGFGDLQS